MISISLTQNLISLLKLDLLIFFSKVFSRIYFSKMNSSKNVFSYIEKGKPILPSKRYIQNANFASISLQTLLSKLCRHISICEKLAWLPARSDDLNCLLLDDYQRPLRRSTKKGTFNILDKIAWIQGWSPEWRVIPYADISQLLVCGKGIQKKVLGSCLCAEPSTSLFPA